MRELLRAGLSAGALVVLHSSHATASLQCPPLEPGINVVVVRGDERFQYARFDQAWKITKAGRVTWPPFDSVSVRGSAWTPSALAVLPSAVLQGAALARVGGVLLTTPFDHSRTSVGTMVAAALYESERPHAPARVLSLFRDTQSPSAGRVIEARGSLEALAWSPSGDHLAIVESQEDSAPRGLFGRIAGYFGHPIPYKAFTLTVHTRAGDLVCTQPIAQDVEHSGASVVWVRQ